MGLQAPGPKPKGEIPMAQALPGQVPGPCRQEWVGVCWILPSGGLVGTGRCAVREKVTESPRAAGVSENKVPVGLAPGGRNEGEKRGWGREPYAHPGAMTCHTATEA